MIRSILATGEVRDSVIIFIICMPVKAINVFRLMGPVVGKASTQVNRTFSRAQSSKPPSKICISRHSVEAWRCE